MISLYKYLYIFEAYTSNKDLKKHGYKYLKNFIKYIADKNNQVILLGKDGIDKVNLEDNKREVFLQKLGEIFELDDVLELTPEKIDELDFSKLSIEILNGVLEDSRLAEYTTKSGKVKPIVWTKLYKEILKDETDALSAEDMEIIVALAVNNTMEKNNKINKEYKNKSLEEKLRIVVGNQKEPLTYKQKLILKYYTNNRKRLDKMGATIYGKLKPEPSSPLIKQHRIEDNNDKDSRDSGDKKWLSKDRTPKTDLITQDGKSTYSLKKHPDSQLMSGRKDDVLSILTSIIDDDLLTSDDINTINSVIDQLEDQDLWKVSDDEDKTKTNRQKINKILRDKVWNNKRICYLFVRESITGEHKFKDNKEGQAQQLVVFDEDDPDNCKLEDVDKLAQLVTHMIVKGELNPQINTKSSNQVQSTVCRISINIPKLNKHAEENKEDLQDYLEYDEEEEVKDSQGSIWIRRRKLKGEGFTYCLKNNRERTMSEEEWSKSQKG